MPTFISYFLHLNVHLGEIISQYGTTTYAILFLIIFLETGVVVTPFLPGDSLLFAAGTLTASTGVMDVHFLFILLTFAAIIGDTVNYSIGRFVGPRAFSGNYRFLKKEHLTKTQKFYEKYGAKTIVLARFVPIVRTFAPFVAGIGQMKYRQFFIYNVVGAVLWCGLFIYAGYFFGNFESVKKNFSLVILGIIIVSVMPIVIEYIKARRERVAEPS